MKRLLLLAVLAVACEGPMGPAGPAGKDGQDGADGSGLVGVYHCSGQANIGTISLNLLHDVYKFADGSALATCYVWGASFSIAGANMWRSGSRGADVGGCLVSADVDSSTYGFWTFDMTSNMSGVAAYNDTGSPYNGLASVLRCTSG